MQPNIPFSQTVILENNVALLRPIQESDFPHLIDFALLEPEIWEFSLVSASGKQGLSDYIYEAIKAQQNQTQYTFIVFDKRTNTYAGCTRFYNIQPTNKALSLGYTWYGKQHQGTGLNKNCKYLLLSYVFENLGFERVEFRADKNNKKSIAAMQSIGCTIEGVLRSDCYKTNGTPRDSIVLSILKTEWLATLKQQLANKL
ncbi:MAG: N-acetyltransferase [Sphingobacteriales bacterium]|nr:MAG: N-acetyltransferase [Sphingobacteriales bacterium]